VASKSSEGGEYGDMASMIRRAEPSDREAYRAIRLPSVCGAGQHCAGDLHDAIADLAVRRQGKRLILEVNESNVRAGRCYGSYGFVETGRRRTMDRLRPSPRSNSGIR
jgi:hypothetical protein